MSKAEIIAQLSHLGADDRAEVQAKPDELAVDAWVDYGELSEADKHALNTSLADYEKSPDEGSPWPDVKARIHAKFRAGNAGDSVR